MRPPSDCDAAFRARLKLRHAPSLLPETKALALAIRLQPCASFQEKLQQLVGKYPIKKAPETGRLLDVPLSRQILAKQLALRELERFARLGAAVLLALDHAGVAREEAALFQNAAQVRLEGGQRLRDTMAHRAGLTRQAATRNGADHVVLARARSGNQGLLDHHAQHRTGEIDFDFTGVDGDLAGAGPDPGPGNRV